MNPTHFAVALKYDENTMAAPRVVAKGADLLAFKIRDAAQGAKVPVLQSPPLARALYKHAEVDQEIPARAVLGRGPGAGLGVPAARRDGRRPPDDGAATACGRAAGPGPTERAEPADPEAGA